MRKLLHIACLFTLLVSLHSCDEAEDISAVNQQTIFVYMPWSGTDVSSGLYSYFLANLDSIYAGIQEKKGLGNSRMVVFLSESASSSSMFEVVYEQGNCVKLPLKEYTTTDYTTAEGITEILNDMKGYAPGLNYAMIIGCHGSGWTFKDTWQNYPNYAKRLARAKDHAATVPYEQTRFFGSVGDIAKYSTDIPVLAEGIRNAGLRMQYILFDDCYMANAEVAYELRDVTNFLIGSTSEVMAIGMPYKSMWSSLASATPSYSGAVSAFNKFYSNYRTPCGTIAAIDCRQMDAVANIMKEINSRFTLADSLLDSLQILDGFSTPLFYDLGDYVNKLCTDRRMYDTFTAQIEKTVNSKAATDSIYSMLYSRPTFVKVSTFSGLTISDPSQHPVAIRGKERTAWWAATH